MHSNVDADSLHAYVGVAHDIDRMTIIIIYNYINIGLSKIYTDIYVNSETGGAAACSV